MGKKKELEKVRSHLLNSLTCPLRDAATNLVFGKGNPEASILFIGEAPGEQEDKEGYPFVGAAGKQLDKLLRQIGLTLDDVYIANILKYRPPNNRNPTDEEIARHTPYLIEQIKVIQPEVICTLGNFSTKFVLAGFKVEGMKKIGGISFLHGKPVEMNVEGFSFKAFPLYHPAACLYKPTLREELEKDFVTLQKVLCLEQKEAKKGLEQWISL
ncbi:uracil-DNA glycosylase [Candidatus Woesearchaeota archaeon]|nr:uracil-DNA glycosylase [Candidatus Woesearchaeota archaeon]HIH38517.1 uracil-DNA glycosylase [Candidatus Woesearchaeota archaeon]HIH48226.1 uracil-DNA glycosylase [Candidatus Woesearchaeota archaeon]HIJ04475.1 uracil-DNA glycosylase [Candidatus Woesearchaeota archaeon]